MTTVRIALANVRIPETAAESVTLATSAVQEAGELGASVICFSECFVPGYRWPGKEYPVPDAAFLEDAWTTIAAAAKRANISVVLGTERVTQRGLQISALVINSDVTIAGWQDKGPLAVVDSLCFIHTPALLNPEAIGQRPMPIRATHSTKRRFSAVQQRTAATSPR